MTKEQLIHKLMRQAERIEKKMRKASKVLLEFRAISEKLEDIAHALKDDEEPKPRAKKARK